PPLGLAWMAASGAVRDAGLDVAHTGPQRVGVVVGTLGGDLKTFEGVLRADPQHKASGFTPPVARTYPLSTILSALADRLGTGGPHLLSVNACSSGNHALASGCDPIRRGDVDATIAGGVAASAQPESPSSHTRPSLAAEHCQPFARNRRGLMIGEGTGMLVLESREHAAKRAAPAYAEVKGYGL